MFFQIQKIEQEWLAVAKQYQELWNFPHSVGAIDGNMWHYSVQKIVPMNALTTKMPSVLYSSP